MVSGVTSMEQWFAAKEPIKFGGSGRAGPRLIFLEYCTRLSGCPSVSSMVIRVPQTSDW